VQGAADSELSMALSSPRQVVNEPELDALGGTRDDRKTLRRQSVSRRTLLTGTAGLLGGALSSFAAFYTREKPPSYTDVETAYRPYIETCIAAFGIDRSIFESNFPPDGASSSYPILWNALKRLAAGYSASEKAMMFSDTAQRVYRLA
jgi:L-fuconolactonase